MMIGAIIQARMGSTRLYGKVMKVISDKTILEHIIERVKQSKMIDKIIIATTIQTIDDEIETEALKCGVNVFRGNEEDVLSRYYYAAKMNELSCIVRICSDCPLIDWRLIDKVIFKYLKGNYDIVTNANLHIEQGTFPLGLGVEVFSFDVLLNAHIKATEKYQREHVTPYIYENSNRVNILRNNNNYSKYRWTLDTEEDWELIVNIYKRLYFGVHNFGLKEIIELMEHEPCLTEINKDIEQKKIR